MQTLQSLAYVDQSHKVCGAGVYACVFNPAPDPLWSAASVRLVDESIYQVDQYDLLSGTRLYRRPTTKHLSSIP